MPTSSTPRFVALVVFLVLAVAVSSALGVITAPREWFEVINKPAFTPPAWLFAPVWLVLYVCIGFAGWLIWIVAPRGLAMSLWGLQMLLNWLWSPVFFSLHAIWPAAAIIVAMLAIIIAFIVVANRVDRRAALLFVPYALWVGFATALNVAIGILN